jgi:aconitase B
MLLPDQVGTGGDSHTRFPLGISFPAGSGLVAFGAALGVIPLDMSESVLVKFTGEMQPGITLRDLVNAIPYAALQRGLLTVEKKGKKNLYNGRILEIQGLPDLTVEQAFELSDASAELIKKAGSTHMSAQTGVVTLIQRFGSALNLNVHFHMLFLDGVYIATSWGKSRFHRTKAPSQQELVELVHCHHRQICYLLRGRRPLWTGL